MCRKKRSFQLMADGIESLGAVDLRQLGAAHCWGLTSTPGAIVVHPK
jgi:hypothetical protein